MISWCWNGVEAYLPLTQTIVIPTFVGMTRIMVRKLTGQVNEMLGPRRAPAPILAATLLAISM